MKPYTCVISILLEVKDLIGIRTRSAIIIFSKSLFYKRNALIFLIVAPFFVGEACAQSNANNTIIGPSPNAAAFDKFGDVPVSAYTGIPNIDIPLYTLTNKEAHVPISISYHAGGIRVSEEASRIGLGWVLNCGGVINRSLRGVDDFMPTIGYLNNSIAEVFNTGSTNGLTASYTNLTTQASSGGCDRMIAGEPVDFTGALPAGQTNIAGMDDLEPDVFSYNFLGYTGKFGINKNRQIILQTPDNIKFQLISADGTSFQVTTPDGNVLTFAQPEYTTYYTGSVTQYQVERYITTWYLTKIVSVTGAEVDFHYSNHGASVEPIFQPQENNNVFTWDPQQIVAQSDSYSADVPTQWHAVVSPNGNYEQILLDSVTSINQSVVLNYATRTDLAGDMRISSISIHNYANSQNNFSYVFNESYFSTTDNSNIASIPSSSLPYYQTRLKLQGLYKQNAAGLDIQNYYFTYNEANQPNKGSLSVDHWGFYNGSPQNTAIPRISYYDSGNNIQTYMQGASRTPNGSFSQVFMLTQIKYPTGGTTKFDYEPNDFDIGNSVGTSNSPNPDLVNYSNYDLTQRGSDGAFTFNVSVLNTNNPLVKIFIQSQNGQTNTQPIDNYANAYLEIYAPGGTTPIQQWDLSNVSLWTNVGNGTYTYNGQFTPTVTGNYTIKTHIDASVSFLNYIDIQPSYFYDQNIASNHSVALGGGLRVLRTTDTDPLSDISKVTKYFYDYQQDTNGEGVMENYSYGRRLTALRYYNYSYNPVCAYIRPAGQFDGSYTATFNLPFTLYSNNAVIANGPPVGYDQVTILHGENGENGKTELHYHNQVDKDFIYNGTVSAPQTYNVPDLRPFGVPGLSDPENGELLEKIDYAYNASSASYSVVRYQINTYSTSAINTQIGCRKLSWVMQQPVAGCSWSDCSWLIGFYPAFQSCWVHPSATVVKEYASGSNNYTQTTTTYLYETSPVHFQPIQTTIATSNTGITLTDLATYPSDYASGTSFIDNMVANNIVKPIETVKYKTDANNNSSILSGKLVTYKSGGQGLVDVLSSLRTLSPIPSSAFRFSNMATGQIPFGGSGIGFSPDSNYVARKQFFYDENNDINQVSTIGGPPISYLWNYNHQYPVAQATNASVNDIFYESFENGAGNSSYNDSKTGHYSYNGSSTAYSISLSGLDNGTYALSCWRMTGSTWTLYTSSVTVSGNSITISQGNQLPAGQIDDVRFYPANASMTTYTYDPLIGMTSSTDAKGETTYYEYDPFQRLMNIRNKDGNIIKHYDYHYQNQ